MHELRALRAEQLGLRRRQLSALAVLLNAERAEHRAAITSAATVTGDTGVDPQVQHQRSRQLALIDRCAAGGARTLFFACGSAPASSSRRVVTTLLLIHA